VEYGIHITTTILDGEFIFF
ncbi:hypothetical protein D047_3624B, partial [Vibrio parahaemolyticus VPTS-2010_2]